MDDEYKSKNNNALFEDLSNPNQQHKNQKGDWALGDILNRMWVNDIRITK